jgi:hypothetical protein
MTSRDDEKVGDQEADRRTEAALRAAFTMPHKTYEESKVRKRKPKPTESPSRRSPVKKSRG